MRVLFTGRNSPSLDLVLVPVCLAPGLADGQIGSEINANIRLNDT